ncbi:hypothetical protein [Saccharothrix deserti]|uniref:hypothetical protein n=1 Tax=Saccharothrix deserti TaxID=2593674 RepID=UPI00131DC445|nr:hypothetical protein [Saccharothrix deserti]
MTRFLSRVTRRLPAALAATAAMCAAAVVVVPVQAQANAPGFPAVYCYRNASGSNPTRLLLAESNVVNGNLAYTIITQRWDSGQRTYVDQSARSKFTAPPSDRSPNGLCRWGDSSYPYGVWA